MYESVIASIKSDKAQFKKEIAQLEKIQRQLEELNIDSLDLTLEIRSRKDRFNSLCDELDAVNEQVKLEKKQQAQLAKQQRIADAELRGYEDLEKVKAVNFSFDPTCPYKQKYLQKAWLKGLHSDGFIPSLPYSEKSVTISLQRIEGNTDEIRDKNGDMLPPTVVNSWKNADSLLKQWAITCPNLGYHKVHIAIDWTDDIFYKLTFNLGMTHRSGIDLKNYIWELVSTMSGTKKPNHMNDEEYKKFLQTYVKPCNQEAYSKIAQHMAAN